MSILVFNAGSSSLKFGLFDATVHETLASGIVDWSGEARQLELTIWSAATGEMRRQLEISNDRDTVRHAVRSLVTQLKETADLSSATIVGHRIVHGGTAFRESVQVDSHVKSTIAQLADLAPLHNPPALEGIEAAEEVLPAAAHVAVFDTTFFARLPRSEFIYPLPYEWYTNFGVRRFGFHGISHAYCAARAAQLMHRDPANLQLVICHLGNGCSATAVRDGVAVATTMGFTPMDGLMMGTRPGSIDPGILTYLQRNRGMSAKHIERALNHASGLLGVSGVSSDYRQVEAAARGGDDRARLALEIYASRVRATIGAFAVTLGRVDALIFTAGVGENSASFRETVCNGLECLGVKLDRHRNSTLQADADIASSNSSARILVVRTREELMIAREVLRVLTTRGSISNER